MLQRRNLQDTRYTAEYTEALNQGLASLNTFCCSFKLPFPGMLLHRLVELNLLLIAHAQWLYSGGGQLRHARHAILGVQHLYPATRKQLKDAWNSIESWQSEVPSTPYIPISEPLVMSIQRMAFVIGMNMDGPSGYLWIMLGILSAVSFYAMLRPNEMFALTFGGIALPDPLVNPSKFDPNYPSS
jgi:hypothetical protein